VQDYVIQHKFN